MIKFTYGSSQPGIKVGVGLGLSRLNCERLLAGQPIRIDLRALNVPYPVEILLLAGEDENHLCAELESAGMHLPSDPDKIHIDPKLGG